MGVGKHDSVRIVALCPQESKRYRKWKNELWKKSGNWKKLDGTKISVHMMLQVFPLGTNANSDECETENRGRTQWSSNLDFSPIEFPEVTVSGKKGVVGNCSHRQSCCYSSPQNTEKIRKYICLF